jgi:putative transposon-encoded protein
MKKINVDIINELKVKNILGFFKKVVNTYGTGAKIDCPKVYLGKEVYVIVTKNSRKT